MLRLEYTGPIPELQGKTALARRAGDELRGRFRKPVVLAQFDQEVTFNNRRMDREWHPFMAEHFTPIGQKPTF